MRTLHRWIFLWGRARVGLVLTPPNGGIPLWYSLVLTFKATNNEVEYETLIIGLHVARGVGATSLRVKCDYVID